jgi:hypothetical protein
MRNAVFVMFFLRFTNKMKRLKKETFDEKSIFVIVKLTVLGCNVLTVISKMFTMIHKLRTLKTA